MNIEIKDICKQDHKKAIQFAIKGMHFDWYLDSKFMLNAYGRYFWYLEMNRATDIYAAYVDGRFAGVLLAEIYLKEKKQNSFWQRAYVRFFDILQAMFFKDGAGVYETTVKAQLDHYLENNKPDGEIIFLAADPECKVKGVGTALLNALEKNIKGMTIYLYTDNACTYQFYEHRGFTKEEETDIVMELPKGKVPLKCFLYSKKV